MARPTSDTVVLRSPAQFKALGHPVRHQLVNLLRQRPATLRHLARALGLAKGTAGYHVQVLRDAGLVEVAESRQVRGGTEQHYALVSRGFRLEGGSIGAARFLVEAALAEMVEPLRGQAEHTVLRHLWLTSPEAAALSAELEAYAARSGSADDPGTRPYGLLISLFPAAIPKLPAATSE